jgi:hypothetical protein
MDTYPRHTRRREVALSESSSNKVRIYLTLKSNFPKVKEGVKLDGNVISPIMHLRNFPSPSSSPQDAELSTSLGLHHCARLSGTSAVFCACGNAPPAASTPIRVLIFIRICTTGACGCARTSRICSSALRRTRKRETTQPRVYSS